LESLLAGRPEQRSVLVNEVQEEVEEETEEGM